ncbi:MAG TPA: hypothetical protein VH396_03255 [Chitinophagaceae bacterium]
MKKLKIVPALLILGSICILNSCKKEVAQTEDTTAVAMSSNTISDDAIASGTQFGAAVQGSTNAKVTLYNKFGVKYVRSIVELKNFKGNMSAEKSLSQKGFKVVLNINWANPSGSGDHRKAVPFPTDMAQYKQQLTKLFNTYKPEIAVIENEPTTDIFHSGPIEHYINELKTAVSVCNQFNVKVADGAIHVPYIEQIMNGKAGSGKALEVKKLIAAYKTLNLDYVNIHTYGPTGKDPDVYQPGLLKKVADYLRKQTGKPVMSNEWTVHNSSSGLIKSMVSGFKEADFKIAIVRSAPSNSGAVSLNRGTNLLPNGVTYANLIK